MTTPTVEVFVFSKQPPEDIMSVVNLFTGTSSNGLKANVNVVAPTERPNVDPDYAMILDAFSKASPDAYVLICKDTAASVAPTNTIMDVIEATITSSQEPGNAWDLFYLAKWLDRCDLYSNLRDVGRNGMKLVDTVSPNGVLCLMFSPQGRAKFMAAFNPDVNPVQGRPLGQVLNSRISARNAPGVTDLSRPASMQRFLAVTTTPNLVEFDITKRRSDSEMPKTVQCQDVPIAGPPKTKNSSSMSFFWFIIVILVVILIVWALVKLSTKTSVVKAPAYITPVAAPYMMV